jgi:hypothetical protein
MKGHGGHQFAFRMFDTNEVIQADDVWFGGRIPREFADRIPANCERVESDDERKAREMYEAFDAHFTRGES